MFYYLLPYKCSIWQNDTSQNIWRVVCKERWIVDCTKDLFTLKTVCTIEYLYFNYCLYTYIMVRSNWNKPFCVLLFSGLTTALATKGYEKFSFSWGAWVPDNIRIFSNVLNTMQRVPFSVSMISLKHKKYIIALQRWSTQVPLIQTIALKAQLFRYCVLFWYEKLIKV